MGKSFPAFTGEGLVVDAGGTKVKYGRAHFKQARITGITNTGSFPVAQIRDWREGHERVITGLGVKQKDVRFIAICAAGVKAPGTDTVFLDRYPGGKLEFGSGTEAHGWNTDRVLMNDFVGQAAAANTPAAENTIIVRGGIVDPTAGGVVMGPGTGFGLAPILPGRTFRLGSSEGGNVSIPCDFDGTELPCKAALGNGKSPEANFLRWLRERIGGNVPLRLEQVLSGDGLEKCHLYTTGDERPASEISDLIRAGKAQGTVEIFGTYLGRKAREAALMFNARRGIWLTGGVIQRNPQLAQNRWFEAAFLNSPTASHESLLANTPIRIFRDEDVALWGAGAFAVDALNEPSCAA